MVERFLVLPSGHQHLPHSVGETNVYIIATVNIGMSSTPFVRPLCEIEFGVNCVAA
jgi:hypothetical protein